MAGGILRIGDFPVGPICRMDASCPATHYHCEDVLTMVDLWQAARKDVHSTTDEQRLRNDVLRNAGPGRGEK